ncbi:endonuclease/exonuclease/phosphatase family protein [Bdellovibrio bacteriovorus]|uniref:endonuclease/exonuclease/phosphatase family protein n=1 Tax=Bdellovibrio bacteriovorus TaxID=959 RepID=UPI0035A6D6D2
MNLSKLLVLGTLLLGSQVHAEQYWQPDNRPPRFCLQNFNAYGPVYASGLEERTERMTGFLQALPKCDVVHLQEVWNESHINKIEKNLRHQYSMTTPNRDSRIGVMSLFMGDIKGKETVNFTVNNEGGVMDSVRDALNVKKAFHVVRAGFFGIDEDFFFMNTHLHPSSSSVRITQILDLLRWRLENPQLKLLLSGDFNADVDSLERKLVMLTLGMHDSMEEFLGGYPKGYCTYCAGNPLGWLLSDHTFDYIFFSNVGESATTLKAIEGQVNMRGTPRKPWSDHYGVRVNFSVEPAKSALTSEQTEARRIEAIETLAVAAHILKKEKGEEFRLYLKALEELSAQLKARSGKFNAYFESYR